MRSPLEDLGLAPHDEDFCACLHYRLDHIDDDEGKPYCVTCRGLGVKAIAFPWHEFHLMHPRELVPVTPTYITFYSPPHGWDRPSSPRQ